MCGEDREASSLSGELARRFPEATLTVHVSLPVTAAALAIRRGEPDRGLELLEPARAYDHAPSAEFWPLFLRGQAYLQLKNGPAADSAFGGILDHPGEVPAAALYPLAYLGRARAATLVHDTARARQAYENLFNVWGETDPDLPPLIDARAEYARLQ